MGPRRWFRRREPLTTPPDVVPLVVIGFAAMFVAHLVFSFLAGAAGFLWVLVTDPARLWDWRVVAFLAGLAV